MSEDELQQEIEQTRQRLGQTVDELASRVDMKARVRARAAEVSGQVRRSQAVRYVWPAVLVAAGLVMAGSAVIWRWRQA